MRNARKLNLIGTILVAIGFWSNGDIFKVNIFLLIGFAFQVVATIVYYSIKYFEKKIKKQSKD
jgi:hypothetical protein